MNARKRKCSESAGNEDYLAWVYCNLSSCPNDRQIRAISKKLQIEESEVRAWFRKQDPREVFKKRNPNGTHAHIEKMYHFDRAYQEFNKLIEEVAKNANCLKDEVHSWLVTQKETRASCEKMIFGSGKVKIKPPKCEETVPSCVMDIIDEVRNSSRPSFSCELEIQCETNCSTRSCSQEPSVSGSDVSVIKSSPNVKIDNKTQQSPTIFNAEQPIIKPKAIKLDPALSFFFTNINSTSIVSAGSSKFNGFEDLSNSSRELSVFRGNDPILNNSIIHKPTSTKSIAVQCKMTVDTLVVKETLKQIAEEIPIGEFSKTYLKEAPIKDSLFPTPSTSSALAGKAKKPTPPQYMMIGGKKVLKKPNVTPKTAFDELLGDLQKQLVRASQ